ncbi:TIGR00289 family protein [archaeon]|nr:MAG: TIGR00289 family protein [archaeon]
MKLAALFSGGKDSLYATYLSIKAGHEIKYLITFKPLRMDSYMFHHPCVELTPLQAEAMGIKQIMVETGGEKEKELDDLEKALAKMKSEIDGVVSGALASNYQKTRIDNICKKLGLESLAPLWKIDTEQYWKNLLENNFEIMITSVAAEGLDEKWLGRIMDNESIIELKKNSDRYGLNLGGEGGEYESFVINAPFFKYKIKIIEANKIWNNVTMSGYLQIKDAILAPKS